VAINVPWSEIVHNATREGWPGIVMAGTAIVLGVFALNVLLSLATDLPTFIWKGLAANPHDLAPLHYYAAAPLCLVPVVLIPGGVVLQYAMGLGVYQDHVVVAASSWMIIGGVLILWLMWWIPQRLMRKATGCGIARVIGLALYLPVHWMMIFLMCAMAYGLALYFLEILMNGSPF
jgi:hypothetical protein